MIIAPQHEISAGKAAEAAASAFGKDMLDPPPVYEAGSSAILQSTSGATTMRPTNYLLLEREHNSIKGQYAIDPSISIPQSLLPLLPFGTNESDRSNVMLKSTYNSIDVDIALLNPRHPMGKPTTLSLDSTHGSVKLQLLTHYDARPSMSP
ncbi:hypothetical protein FIBSPDRAFT_969170 [Athelia psychrophila]|uniref:DUF7330 domain-containing protein n=1 Tax=Athelia psychrophila TaxID=1759441 RepID=A0A167TTE6_9AGAM|nr:hypothetical protein FIBSPDRAFT_969170 [Fibularhizoctonia sp. CBS 109695]